MYVGRYSACEIPWPSRKQLVVSTFEEVLVTAIVAVFPAGTYQHYQRTAAALRLR